MMIDTSTPFGALASELLTVREGLSAPPEPPFQRPAGVDDREWTAQLARARAAHNEYALLARRLLDEVSERMFGPDAPRLPELPIGAAGGIEIHESTVSVPTAMTLHDLDVAHESALPLGPVPPMTVPDVVEVPVRLYRAHGVTSGPVVIALHGGAFWMGGGDLPRKLDGPMSEWIARAIHGTVVELDYRLAPEHPYPASIVDLIVVLDWVREHAAELAADTSRLAVLGVSSGGNVAAVAAVIDSHRAIPHPPLAAQVLVVPALNLADPAPLHRTSDAARQARERQLRGYLGADLPPTAPFVSPALGAPASGAPPAIILTGEFDEVALGGVEWRDRLRAAGIRVLHHEYPMSHTVAAPATSARMAGDIYAGLSTLLGP